MRHNDIIADSVANLFALLYNNENGIFISTETFQRKKNYLSNSPTSKTVRRNALVLEIIELGELRMKVYVTKNALKTGIFEMEIEKTSEDGNIVYGKVWDQVYFKSRHEWYKSEEDAKQRAEEMRKKEIERLKKQIKKLEDLKF